MLSLLLLASAALLIAGLLIPLLKHDLRRAHLRTIPRDWACWHIASDGRSSMALQISGSSLAAPPRCYCGKRMIPSWFSATGATTLTIYPNTSA